MIQPSYFLKIPYISQDSILEAFENKNTLPIIMIDCQPLQHEIRGIGNYGVSLVNCIIKNNKNYHIKLLVNNFLS